MKYLRLIPNLRATRCSPNGARSCPDHQLLLSSQVLNINQQNGIIWLPMSFLSSGGGQKPSSLRASWSPELLDSQHMAWRRWEELDRWIPILDLILVPGSKLHPLAHTCPGAPMPRASALRGSACLALILYTWVTQPRA